MENLFLFQAQLFLNKTVGELLFEGYEDDLITIGDAVANNGDIPMDKFGWFYKVVYFLKCLFFLERGLFETFFHIAFLTTSKNI
jgi:hypothetical protein